MALPLLKREFLKETEDFYSFSNKIGFNTTDYVRDAENVCGEHKCFAQLTRYHKMPSFWGQWSVFPNCEYSLDRIGSGPQNLEFEFEIRQTRCKSPKLQTGGGALIEAFARSDDELVRCETRERAFMTGAYEVKCVLLQTKCLRLTVLLSSENFDHFTHNATRPQRIHVISDDVEFCKEFHTTSNDGEQANSAQRGIVRLPDGVSFHSGRWLSQPRLKSDNIGSQPNSVTFLPPFPHWDYLNNASLVTMLRRNTAKAVYHQVPAHVVKAAYGPKDLFSHYMFEPLVIARPESESIKDRPVDLMPIRPINVNDSISQLSGLPLPHNFIFVGSSNERFMFDSIAEKLLGSDIFTDLIVKHDNHTFERASNIHYDFVAYSEHLAYYLQNLCSGIVRGHTQHNGGKKVEWIKGLLNEIRNFTVILGTGSWDLDNAYPLFTLHTKRSAAFLTSVIKKIRSGRIQCPGLKRLVFVLPYPYPLQHDFPKAPRQGFRNTMSTGALNSYFIRELTSSSLASRHRHDTAVDETPKLSLIDTFGIASPRLLLDENVEVCNRHFICRIHRTWEGHLDINVSAHGAIIHTPAGVAVLQSVMHALAPEVLR